MAQETVADAHQLTSTRRLAWSTVWSFAGNVAPMLVGILTIPVLVRRMGIDRFGVLTFAWMVVGYFGLFDLGLGRALTKVVAERLGADRAEEIPALIWTGLGLMAALGVVATAGMIAVAPWLARSAMKIPQPLIGESISALRWIALGLPFVMLTAGLRGVLEAHQRFDLATYVRVPMGVFNFAGPWLVLPFSIRLDAAVAVLVAGRVIFTLAHALACRVVMPTIWGAPRFDRSSVRPLVTFGGWLSISNVISPLMTYLDRFIIAALVSMSAVAYYVTPYEVVTKLWIIPGALVGVLFPAFAASLANDPAHAARLLDRGLRYLYAALLPVTIAIVALAHAGLQLWLGADFADHGFRVVQWLAVGVFINSIAQLPFVFIQGAGRADITAKLHLVELPFYLLVLWWLINVFGIIGAAVAWVLRIAVDTALIWIAARRSIGVKVPVRGPMLGMAFALLVALLASFTRSAASGLAFTLGAFCVIAPLIWRYVLGDGERSMVRSMLGWR